MQRIFFVRKRPAGVERARQVSRLLAPLLFLLFVCLGRISPTGAALAIYSDMQEDTDFTSEHFTAGLESQVNRRALLSRNRSLWEDGIIPYTLSIESTLRNKQVYIQNVMTAMSWWENTTCIRFVNYINQPYHAVLRLRPGRDRCRSFIGQSPYPSTLYESCLRSVGDIVHELGHIIGFFHEHLRHDRDNYIRMNWDNIASQWKDYYADIDSHFTYVGTTYDPGSIMHYAPYNFDALNHSLPVFTLQKYVRYAGEIGQRNCLSTSDVEATNRMYSCLKSAVPANLTDLPIVCPAEPVIVDIVYSGDRIGLKCKNGSFNRWIECDGEVCRASGCPGNEFDEYYVQRNDCSNAMFTIVVPNSDGPTPVRVGDSIVLSVTDPSDESKVFPLDCSSTEGNCSLNTNMSCHPQNISDCQQQTFKVVVPGKKRGDVLKHSNTLILQDYNRHKLSLGCDYGARRRKQRKCYLQKCTLAEGCSRKRQRFLVFSLSR